MELRIRSSRTLAGGEGEVSEGRQEAFFRKKVVEYFGYAKVMSNLKILIQSNFSNIVYNSQAYFFKNYLMKLKILFALLLTEQIVSGQELAQNADTSNYYDYFSSYQTNKNIRGRKLTTNWLRINEVIPVIMDELQKGGFDWLYDNKLFKVDSGQYVVLAAYSRKSNFGFLYIEGHEVPPSKRHRRELSQQSDRGVDYISCEETPTGEPNFVKIKKLPKNIFILNENCYWYQYTENPVDNNFLITKEIALNILRQDIKAYLVKVPKPKQ